jgi:hypothetical protein
MDYYLKIKKIILFFYSLCPEVNNPNGLFECEIDSSVESPCLNKHLAGAERKTKYLSCLHSS